MAVEAPRHNAQLGTPRSLKVVREFAQPRERVWAAPAVTPIPEDNPKNKGDKVGTLALGLVADPDAKAKPGLAITGFTAGFGLISRPPLNGGSSAPSSPSSWMVRNC